MKIHKINLENNYRNLVDSAIAVKAGLTPAVFAARPTYNDVLLGFNDGETPTLLLPKWAQFTIDLSKNKPSWAPASLTGTLTVTITPSVVGVTAEEDEVTLGNVDVYGVSVASTGKQYKVNEGFYSIGLNVMVVNEDNVPVIAYSDGRPMKVVMQKVADNGPDTNVDVAAGGGGSFTQEQADWNQSDDTAVDFIKNKPTIPAAQVNADWNAASGVAQILNKPTIPAAQVNSDWNATSGVSEILNKPTIPTVNDATLTFTQDGETLATFSANASTNVEVEIPAGGGGGGASIIEKTWSELKAMRDGGTLVPGQQYRITDYVATTVQYNTSSANHPFDIIVTADSGSKLNEVARAVLHSGDTYFANCKLESWKLWYYLDNDTSRFYWADSTNGKGVIYRMIDERNNDCPYDFKGIKVTIGLNTYFTIGTTTSDYSIDATKKAAENKLGAFFEIDSKYYKIPCCAFVGYCHDNTIEWNCKNCLIGENSSPYSEQKYNLIRSGSADIILEHDCSSNNIGTNCNQCTIGSNGVRNTIGAGCSYVKLIGSSISSIKCDSNCLSIKFNSNYMSNIVVDPGCRYIDLSCSSTTGYSTRYQNVKICSGVAGTSDSNRLTISDSNVNQAYQTTFFNETDGTLKKQEGSTVTAYTPPA